MIHFFFHFLGPPGSGSSVKSDRITVALPHAPGTAPSGTIPALLHPTVFTALRAPYGPGADCSLFFGARVRTPYKNKGPFLYVTRYFGVSVVFSVWNGSRTKRQNVQKIRSVPNSHPGPGSLGAQKNLPPPHPPFSFLYTFSFLQKNMYFLSFCTGAIHTEKTTETPK
jgi:hypothetical protein